ncbi:MAG: 4-hydroxybenzoate octaprenyltransferase [Burkholderiales bacterium RIFOXYC12_FULL_60_6]|nr:MAG: 4-hydroxybenzoate octaprenyltransferase [Burkholderiales bacterium RIFOXYD12_FULL_59_19]OGB79015.1 MAG: 4-hydroxybenzoate octaprenyltransferase [Burkholderiales bacterium RIFOXYC12_FULL_60_6]
MKTVSQLRAHEPSRLALSLELIRWRRPEGWLLLLWPTFIALWVAARGFPGWSLLAIFGLGTILMRSAGCCVNDTADSNFDMHVERTKCRPIARGALSRRQALTTAVWLATASFGLVLMTNLVTITWAIVAGGVAVLYPFTKRVFAMPQLVLGIAFSFGIPMAFAATHGVGFLGLGPDIPAIAGLVSANLLWVLAYDTVYAMVDREDDLRIGIRSSAITLGRWDVIVVTTSYVASLLVLSATVLMTSGRSEILFGCAVAAVLIAWHSREIRTGKRERRLRSFVANHWIGCALFVGTALSFSQ